MKTLVSIAAVLFAMLFAVQTVHAQDEDTVPPIISGFTVAPLYVNTVNRPAVVTVSVTVTDDLSGVRMVVLQFRHENDLGNEHLLLVQAFEHLDGNVLRGTGTLPPYSKQGTWRIIMLAAADKADNRTVIDWPGTMYPDKDYFVNTSLTAGELPYPGDAFVFAPLVIQPRIVEP